MPANECIPYFEPNATFTAKATGAVTGKRFVKIGATRTGGGGEGAGGATTVGVGLSTDLENLPVVKRTGAKDRAVGVAGWDAADKAEVKVFATGHGLRLPVTSGAAITAGEEVESDAEGRAIPFAAGVKLGVAFVTVGGANLDTEILFY